MVPNAGAAAGAPKPPVPKPPAAGVLPNPVEPKAVVGCAPNAGVLADAPKSDVEAAGVPNGVAAACVPKVPVAVPNPGDAAAGAVLPLTPLCRFKNKSDQSEKEYRASKGSRLDESPGFRSAVGKHTMSVLTKN